MKINKKILIKKAVYDIKKCKLKPIENKDGKLINKGILKFLKYNKFTQEYIKSKKNF